jgi:hypothetical protein
MITTTQIGLVAENLVTNKLVIASKGRLAPFRPVADDYGIDLLLYDKLTGRALPLQVKARTNTLKKSGRAERGKTVHFEIREVALRQKGITRLLAVLLDEEMTTIRCGWMIPLVTFEQIAAKRGKKFVIRPSSSETSKDKFRSYYFQSFSTLVEGLLAEFERFDPAFPARIRALH